MTFPKLFGKSWVCGDNWGWMLASDRED
jgi:hypothetical protein